MNDRHIPVQNLLPMQVVQPQSHLHENGPDLGLRHAAAVLPPKLVQDALEVAPGLFCFGCGGGETVSSQRWCAHS